MTHTPSREMLVALRDADLIPACTKCKRARGLCRAHRREILPQLAKPTIWLRLLGKMHAQREQPVDRMKAIAYEAKRARRMQELVRAVGGRRARLRGRAA